MHRNYAINLHQKVYSARYLFPFARGDSGIQPKRKPMVFSLAIRLVFSLSILFVGVVIVAKMGKVSSILDLPSSYLPGNHLPRRAKCFRAYASSSCIIALSDREVYFEIDMGTRRIICTDIRAQEYTAGDLIAAWGTPTGISQDGPVINIYWGKRSAFLYTNSFQPESQIGFIRYTLESQPASPWRGFTNDPARISQ